MNRSAIALAVVLVAAGAALAGVYLSLSPRFLTAEIERTVAQATGRPIVISSRPALSLWPEIGVTYDGIRLSNPPEMAAGIFADIDRLELKMNATALLRSKPEISQITLVRPRFNLVVDGQGRVSWNIPGGRPPAEDTGAAAALMPIFIEDGTLVFRDERTGEAALFEDLDLVLKLASVHGPVELKGHADWRGDRVQLALFIKTPQEAAGAGSALDLNLSTSLLTLAFNGHAAVRNGTQLAGQFDITSPSAGAFLGWSKVAGSKRSDLGAFAARGGLTLSKNVLVLKNARLAVDGMKAEGDVTVDLSQATPRVSARLGVDRIDVDRYAPFRELATGSAGEGVEAWSKAPIDFSGLKAIDATAALRIRDLVYGGLSARDVTLDATLTGGVLDAKLRDISLYDGKATGQIVFNGARAAPTIQASFQGRGLDGHRLLKSYAGFEAIEGLTEIAVAIAAQGQNEIEMISSLRGSAGFNFTAGAIRGINIASILRGFSKNTAPGWPEVQGERTDFSLLKASFTLSDGVAENNDLQLLGPIVRMSGAGNVDLLRREIDFRIEPRLVASRDGQDGVVDAGVPVIVKGPWGKPTIAPEAKQ